MSEQRGLTWSKKWHVVADRTPGSKYMIARCGAYLYDPNDPQYPPGLKLVRDGKRKSTGTCKICVKSAKIKQATVEFPESENGGWHVQDVGDVECGDSGVRIRNIGRDLTVTPKEARQFAAALLAAAEEAEGA